MFFFVCLQSILFWASHDLCSTQGRQEKSITVDDIVHIEILRLLMIMYHTIDKITKRVDGFSK